MPRRYAARMKNFLYRSDIIPGGGHREGVIRNCQDMVRNGQEVVRMVRTIITTNDNT